MSSRESIATLRHGHLVVHVYHAKDLPAVVETLTGFSNGAAEVKSTRVVPSDESIIGVLTSASQQVLQVIAEATGVHPGTLNLGLGMVRKRLSTATCKKLRRLDTTCAFLRHYTSEGTAAILRELRRELSNEDEVSTAALLTESASDSEPGSDAKTKESGMNCVQREVTAHTVRDYDISGDYRDQASQTTMATERQTGIEHKLNAPEDIHRECGGAHEACSVCAHSVPRVAYDRVCMEFEDFRASAIRNDTCVRQMARVLVKNHKEIEDEVNQLRQLASVAPPCEAAAPGATGIHDDVGMKKKKKKKKAL
eukprot:TRINITY_DN30837_c0_g1_i1.p1 TRINITY_DN30837_c0_g1~~TRINITY_DN30837_c0_g1_i1.p1  ORF type:complete len:310 (+),score=67.50 TRINITY_DN30837_c0_g1_i1:81-1010(+)